MKNMLSDNSTILRRVCSIALIFLHILTFGPVGETLAYTAQSANYRLNSGTATDGSNNRDSASYRLALEAAGEPFAGRLQSASYQIRSGFVYTTESNPPEFINSIPNQGWPKNEPLISALDLDDYFQSEQELTFAVSANAAVTVSIDPVMHIVSFSQSDGYYGTETIYFTATDAEGNSARSNNIILQVLNVNNPPVLSPIPDITASEGELIAISPEPYVEETDADPITYSFTAPFDANGQWQTDFHDGDGGSRTYTVTVTAVDKDGSTSREVKVIVNNVNRAPVIQPMQDIAGNENELVRIEPQVTDEDEEPVEIWYSGPFGTNGIWLPGYNDAGAYDVFVYASDNIDTVSEQVRVIIQNVNRAPEASLSLSSYSLEPNQECQLTLNASDSDNDNMTFSIKKDGVQIASGTIIDTYTMPVSFTAIGDHSVEATVTDNGIPYGLSATDTKGLNVIDPNADRDAITPVMGDFDGDSLTDIGFHDMNTGMWDIAISDGGTFTNTTSWLSEFGTSRDWIPISGDFNGDGITDIGIYNNTTGPDGGKCKIAVSTGSSFTISEAWVQFEESSYDWQPLTGDFNIDKYADLGLYNKKTGEVRIAFSDSSSFGGFESWINSFGGDGHTILTGDFNGDGLPDICAFQESTGQWQVALNNTKGFVDSAVWLSGFAQNKSPLTADFNNDGLIDIGYWDKDSGSWYYAASTGNGFADKGIWHSGFGESSDDYAYTGDFNGDGITNPAVFDKDKDGIEKWDTSLSAGDFSGHPVRPDLLVRIENGTGGTTQVSYDYASNYMNQFLPFPVYVVKTVTLVDMLPEGSEPEVYGQYFSYAGGYYDAVDREFRGFAQATVKDPVTENYTTTYFYQGKPGQDGALKGKIEKLLAYDGNGQKISEALNTWKVRKAGPSGDGLGFPYLEKVRATVWENTIAVTTESEFIYDNLGNIKKTVNKGDINVDDDPKISRAVFTPAYEGGFNRPLEVMLQDKDENIINKKTFEYDNSGNLTKELAWLNTDPDNSPYASYSYDSFGNITNTQNSKGSNIYTTYESNYYTFPETVTNELSQSIHYKYNAGFGVVEQITDTNANTTTSVYDTYGRVIEQKNPENETVTTYSYPDFNTKLTTQLNMVSTEYADGLGRAYKTVTSGEDGDMRRDIIKEVFYNNRGQVDYETLPHYIGEEPKSFIRYSYDLRGRVVSATADYEGTAQDAASYTNYLSPLEVETLNAAGQKKTTRKDVYGNVVEVIEYNGTTGVCHTYYKYDIQGSLIEVTDAQANHTYINYDSLGRKINMTDPDMGLWLYEYDKMGNLIRQTDAKSQVIEFQYDKLSRLITKAVGAASGREILASYEYDDPLMTNATGRLTKVTDANGYTTTYNYDKEGRITNSAVTIDGNSYITSTTYDILGRIKSVTYPDGETVNYTYDTNSGQLQSVGAASGGEEYISDITYSAMGQIRNISYGNQTQTNYTYRPDHKLQNIKTISPDGYVPIQNLSYEFDKANNITKLIDNIKSNIREFSYDDLSRLTQARNVPDPGGGYKTITYQYDSIGNMTYKSDLGVLSYGIGAGPHAVTSAGGYSYSYDANGNQTSGRGRGMTYDIENHLMKITTPSGEVQFQYDADGKRIKKVSQTEAAIYVSGSYEIRKTSPLPLGGEGQGEGVPSSEKIIKHIFTGSDRSITIEKINGQTHTYFCHNDHLGSTNLITDENGFIVQECEYTPYGQVAQNTGTYNSPFKFTGKELDDATELYYYGARYYDPVLCHFIQADSIVPQPLDPQTLNRYSYCYNNPLKYTDPSGNFGWFIAAIIGAIVGAVVGGITAHQAGEDVGAGILFGAAVGFVTSAIGYGIGHSLGNAIMTTTGAPLNFFEGALVTGIELGIAGFGTGATAAFAAGGDFGDIMKSGAKGFVSGFAIGAIIGGTYAAGWQSIVHGFDSLDEAAKKVAELYAKGDISSIQLAQKLEWNLMDRFGTTRAMEVIESHIVANEAALAVKAVVDPVNWALGFCGGTTNTAGSSSTAIVGRLRNAQIFRSVGKSLFKEASMIKPVTAMKQIIVKAKQPALLKIYRGICAFFGKNINLEKTKIWVPK